MKTYIIDTNALISFITDRDIEQQKKIAQLFEDTANRKSHIICPQNVLTEFVYVMEKIYSIKKNVINQIIKHFITMPGIEIVHDIDFELVLSLWPEIVSDFGDALVASVCAYKKSSYIASFDKKLTAALKKFNIDSVF